MLIIGRKRDQKIIIADKIEITVLDISRNRVRFGVKAPQDVRIHAKLQSLPVPDEDLPSEPSKTASDQRLSQPARVVAAGSAPKH